MDAKRNVIIVQSMRCAGYLMLNGCKLIRTEPHRNMPNKNIFVFYDDAKVNQYIRKYKNEECQTYDAKKIYTGSNKAGLHDME